MGLLLLGSSSGGDGECQSAPSPPYRGPPRRFGDYELLGEIARGGMGVVYRARQISLNRVVAVKVLLFGSFASDAFVKRFRAEAEAAASLRHPSIVAIHEVGEQDGQHYFSMELVEGRSLDAMIRDRPMSARQSACYVQAIAEAVEYAHRHGVLHRDLKPSNVLIDVSDLPRITDFGLAKRLTADSELTLPGQVLGSPSFMPPEQAEPGRGTAGPASDIYSLGAILYHLLTGRPPFVAETVEGTLAQLLQQEPVSPRLLNSAIPRDLETICLKCLEKDPARRYSSARSLADDLEHWLAGEPIVARSASAAERVWRWCCRKPALAALWGGLAAALCAGLTGIAWQWRRAESNAIAARHEAERARGAESDAKKKLRLSLLEQARAERRSGEAGQRYRALQAVTRAAALQPSLELRNEAIAALALPDLRFVAVWTNLNPDLGSLFTPSQTRFAVPSASGRVKVFRTSDAGEEMAFPAIGGIAQRLQFSPDERFLAASYSTGSNVVWELATGRKVLSWGSGVCGEFTPDSQRLLAIDNSRLVRCLSVPEGREFWRCSLTSSPWNLAIHPRENRFVLMWYRDRNVDVRDLGTGELVRTLTHPSPVGMLTWSPDGMRLIVGVENGVMYMWDVDSEVAPESWKAHDDVIVALAFARTSNWLASGSWDGTVRLWNWPDRSLAVTARGFELRGPRFSTDAQWLAGVVRRPILGKFEISTSTGFSRLSVPQGDQRGAWSMDVSSDRTLVAVAYADGLRVLDLATGRELAFQPIEGGCRSAIFTPDGSGVITCGSSGLARSPIERTTTTAAVRLGSRQSIVDGVLYLASMSQDGRWVAAANRSAARLEAYEVNHPANRFALTNHPGVQFVALSPNGRWAASGTWKGRAVRIWDLETRARVRELPVDGSATVAFSPDSRLLASGSDRCQVWEVGSWRELYRTAATQAETQAIAFSPDSRILAVNPGERAVQLLEANTGRVLTDLTAPGTAPVSWLRFTPDGATLLALEWTWGIQVWDLRRLRAELAVMNLDWDATPDPPAK